MFYIIIFNLQITNTLIISYLKKLAHGHSHVQTSFHIPHKTLLYQAVVQSVSENLYKTYFI